MRKVSDFVKNLEAPPSDGKHQNIEFLGKEKIEVAGIEGEKFIVTARIGGKKEKGFL